MLDNPKLGMSELVFFWVETGTLIHILIWFQVPETKGRSYAELNGLFARKVPAWRFSDSTCS
ncbi:hypothetical protein ASPCAL09857 [Aspergillus calidoustus]|uniref:Uncharacterized protein n=1 Tax=Aspergillus calidoustus TaxID=454130 RepID=A0A0U5G6Z9_ASPCI|nr:hypothetical protein ASPCAL09857 [Aspergillus calidoustus]